MRMTLYRNSILLLLFLIVNSSAWGWGPKGHDIVAAIAEQHLTPKAKKSIQAILDSHSLVYYASWMDQVMKHPEYASVQTWHYANVDEGESYETMQKCSTGDVYTGLTTVIEGLKSRELDDSLQRLYVKFLIHLMGDLHCPMHAGRLSDRGGNDFPVQWFGRPTNLHSLWDTSLLESVRSWSYTEWRDNIDTANETQIAEKTTGDLLDWLNQTVDLCKEIYLKTSENENYSYDYMYEYYPVIELQLQRGGYRLARILNEIYG